MVAEFQIRKAMEEAVEELRRDREQKARIALLEHYTSQMQAYKVYVLTILVAFFAGVESLRVLGFVGTFWLKAFVSFGAGFLAAGFFFCLVRFMWYGAFVSYSIWPRVVVDDRPDADTLMYQLRTVFQENAKKEKRNAAATWMVNHGDKQALLFAVAGVVWFIVSVVVFVVLLVLGPPMGSSAIANSSGSATTSGLGLCLAWYA
jgi:hypothetical protein